MFVGYGLFVGFEGEGCVVDIIYGSLSVFCFSNVRNICWGFEFFLFLGNSILLFGYVFVDDIRVVVVIMF